jgi:hypothetical protein
LFAPQVRRSYLPATPIKVLAWIFSELSTELRGRERDTDMVRSQWAPDEPDYKPKGWWDEKLMNLKLSVAPQPPKLRGDTAVGKLAPKPPPRGGRGGQDLL